MRSSGFTKKKKEAGQLSINLTHPTSVNLRNECRLLFIDGCNKTDQRMLREFLGTPFGEEIYESTIKRCDPDKFKPLDNCLKKGSKTHEKNIELLARLIDFRPRPYTNYRRISDGKTGTLSMLPPTEGTTLPERPLTSPLTVKPNGQNTYVHFLPLLPAIYFGARQILNRIGKRLLMRNSSPYNLPAQNETYSHAGNGLS